MQQLYGLDDNIPNLSGDQFFNYLLIDVHVYKLIDVLS